MRRLSFVRKSVGLRDGLTIQPSGKLGIGQRGEGLGNLGLGDAVVVDDEALEECLISTDGLPSVRGKSDNLIL
jgi:hypothetical protein